MKQADGLDSSGGTEQAQTQDSMVGQPKKMAIASAEVLLPSKSIADDLAFWTSPDMGFRMDQIYPADNPQVVALFGHGLNLRLETTATTSPGTIRLLSQDPNTFGKIITSPSGTRIEYVSADLQFPQPATEHAFRVGRLKDGAPWIVGRAGMHYRDLIPSRLGGAIIASHIRIPDAGPVPDKVHYHAVGFQLIYCYAGWVRLVYEDQGPPFILRAGDCVIQPPRIRHRVLEASENLQVIEVGIPAEHITTIDWEMELPTATKRPDREWEGQKFVHSLEKDASWGEWRIPGFEARDTGIGIGTKGVATVRVARPTAGNENGGVVTSHDSDILFTFVLAGTATLDSEGHGSGSIVEGDAYTLPPGHKTSLSALSPELRLLEVSLPADFKTTVYEGERL